MTTRQVMAEKMGVGRGGERCMMFGSGNLPGTAWEARVVGVWLVATAVLAQPNLVLISLDTTRADALSCYGSPPGLLPGAWPDVTPHVDALAERGVRFEKAWASAPSTLSSHATIFTGSDPHQHGVVRNGFPLVTALPTLAERLLAAGWETIAVVAAAPLDGSMGLERGFEVYDDVLADGVEAPALWVVERALAHVSGRPSERPLFLFVHLYDPHAPYLPDMGAMSPLARCGSRSSWRGEGSRLPVDVS